MKKIISFVLVFALCCTLAITSSAEDDMYYEENSLHFYISEDEAVFYGCREELSGDVVVPAYVKGYPVVIFDDDALDYATKITSITLPETLKVIYTDGFQGAESLENIYVDVNNSEFISVDGVLYEKDTDMLVAFPKGRTGSYTVPAFTKSINATAFNQCKIEEVIIDSQLNEIELGTFRDCTNLKKITFPDSITCIGSEAFKNCTSLESVDLPKSLMWLDEGAFSYCSSLKNINISSENEFYTSVDGVLFDEICSLIQYPIGNSRDYYAIPEETYIIDKYAFAGCKNLRTIAFHQNVNTVGYCAFDSCEGLEKIEYDGTGFHWDEIDIDSGNEALESIRPDGGFIYYVYNILNIPVVITGGAFMWIWLALSLVVLGPVALVSALFGGALTL